MVTSASLGRGKHCVNGLVGSRGELEAGYSCRPAEPGLHPTKLGTLS